MNFFHCQFYRMIVSATALSLLLSAKISAQAPIEKTADTPSPANAAGPTTQEPAAAASEQPEAPQIPLIHKPYEVRVEVGFEGTETISLDVRNKFTADIRDGLTRMYGSMWETTVKSSDWLIPAGTARLQRLNESDLQARYASTSAEKVILISVMGNNGMFEVSCREFDNRVLELTPLLAESTADIQSVSNIACRLTRDSFRPVLLFSGPSIQKTELEFELQAGTLIPPDPSAAQIAQGDVLRTFIRQLDRRNPGKVKLLQKLDLCYVRVTSFNRELRADSISPEDTDVKVEGITADQTAVYTDGGHVQGVLIAHGMVPFGGRSRSMEQIALRQRPSASKSSVRLVLQSRPDRPLICYRVDRVAKLRQTDVNESPGVRMLSDRNGDIEIAVDPENPTFWLYVYSGSALLARVPYAPGLIPRDSMKLPDDSVRLGVEGELYLLRDQLVDMVAQKAVHMSLAKKAAAEGNLAAVEASILQLDALPTQKRFEEQLNKIRTDAVTKATLQKNTAAQRKVENLCKKMSESLALFFAADKRVKDAQELEKLRQSAESRAGAVAPTETPSPAPAPQ